MLRERSSTAVLLTALLASTPPLHAAEPPVEWTSAHGSGVDAGAAMARHGLVRKNVPIRDYTPPLAADFDAAAAWLDEVFADEAARLYAHCRVGIQRTPTILAAWLALRDGGSAADAVLAMRRHDRYPGLPLPHQLAAAERWLAARREAS